MSPKEKANILITKFIKHSRAEKDIKPIQSAKQCALIAVDEILDDDVYDMSEELFENRINYWEQVKQEIEKL